MNFKFTNDSPIYTQLTYHLKLYIASGKLKPNEKLPSVRELAMQIKINPNTSKRKNKYLLKWHAKLRFHQTRSHNILAKYERRITWI